MLRGLAEKGNGMVVKKGEIKGTRGGKIRRGETTTTTTTTTSTTMTTAVFAESQVWKEGCEGGGEATEKVARRKCTRMENAREEAGGRGIFRQSQ